MIVVETICLGLCCIADVKKDVKSWILFLLLLLLWCVPSPADVEEDVKP
jgi:hypothetical protein